MNCREFEHLWSTRRPGALPPAARDHLSSCPVCAAEAVADTAVDAALHRIGAVSPAVDTNAARLAIRRAVEQRSPDSFRFHLRLSLGFAAACLTAAALAAVLSWPAIRRHGSGSFVAKRDASPTLPVVPPSPRTTPQPEWAPRRQVRPVRPGVDGNSSGTSKRRSSPPRLQRLNPTRSAPQPERPEEPRLVRGIDGTPSVVLPIPTPDRIPGWRSQPPRNAPGEVSSADLLFLNEGSVAGARPYAPRPAPALPLPALPPVQARAPGSVVVDDLLNLNPILVASSDDSGFQALAASEPATDPRLQQKVIVHVSGRIEDMLRMLSQATGVQLIARLEVADEGITLWEEHQSLMEVMRDLRHLRGYYWSRSKRSGQYVYSLWQDAQSRARDEAVIQRQALERHRQFEESIWKHVRALHADEAEMKQWAREDPYFVAEMRHPVVRAGYQLFAALAPDQQAQLLQGQTPSRGLSAGEVMNVFAVENHPGDQFTNSASWVHSMDPLGDVVTLTWTEMTPAQRAATESILRGAAVQQTREAEEHKRQDPSYDASRTSYELSLGHAMAAAALDTATVSLFRWGDPTFEGLSLRVNVQSGGRDWGLYSNIGTPPGTDDFYNDLLRRGQFRLWTGAQAVVERYLGASRNRAAAADPAPPATPAASEKPDPILDAPVSLTWPLLLRQGQYRLNQIEVLDALQRAIRHPLVLDGLPGLLEQPRTGPAEFRWDRRPVRGLLQRFFPGWSCRTDDGTIILQDPKRLRWRLNQLPRAVDEFLWQPGGPYTLDDVALVARSLRPWQVVKLQPYLPNVTIDETLAAQELLKLYGELGPAQRQALAQGLPFTALTPIQQALFLRYAQRQRPFVEPWRFQHGGLLLTMGPSPVKEDGRGAPAHNVTRALFQVRFDEDDTQPFPVDLFPRTGRVGWKMPLSTLIGKPFPGFEPITWHMGGADAAEPVRQPVLTEARLRHRPEVIVIARPFAVPYVGMQPAPDSEAWARALAAPLQGTGVTVVDVRLGPWPSPDGGSDHPEGTLPNLIRLWEPGDIIGQPFDSTSMPEQVDQSPTIFLVGGDEIVRGVFEGPDARDTARVESAARQLLSPPAGTPAGPR
jgi:hypothetical protein